MPGIVYETVKKYDDRVAFTITKYGTKKYQPMAATNKMTLQIRPIEDLPQITEEYGIKFNLDEEVLKDNQETFAEKSRSKFSMQLIDTLFWEALDELPIGADLMELRKRYGAKLKEHRKQQLADQKREKLREYEVFKSFIGKPEFRRSLETPMGISDFAEVEVSLSMLVGEEEIPSLLEKYKEKIHKDVLNKVAESPAFKRMNIPVNMLQIDKVLYTKKTRTLHYLLSLKKI